MNHIERSKTHKRLKRTLFNWTRPDKTRVLPCFVQLKSTCCLVLSNCKAFFLTFCVFSIFPPRKLQLTLFQIFFFFLHRKDENASSAKPLKGGNIFVTKKEVVFFLPEVFHFAKRRKCIWYTHKSA